MNFDTLKANAIDLTEKLLIILRYDQTILLRLFKLIQLIY